MKVGIAAHPTKPLAVSCAKYVLSKIGSQATVEVSKGTAAALGVKGTPIEQIKCDVLIAIGGDGMFVRTLMQNDSPMLAIHAGTLGALAEINGSDISQVSGAIERVLARKFDIESRMKLALSLEGHPLRDATNEVALLSSEIGKMRQLDISVDGGFIGRVRGDGLIVAAPTGSTAYALSAHGPIVHPSLDSIQVTALAPFQLTQRAVLFSPEQEVSISSSENLVVSIDGQEQHPMSAGSSLCASRSKNRAKFVRFGTEFFHRMRGKSILPWHEEQA